MGKVDTDTMRSSRSLASAKSVTIDPEVTEFHYRGRQEEGGRYHNPRQEGGGYHNPVAEEGLEESEGGSGRVLEGREGGGHCREGEQSVQEGQHEVVIEAEEGQKEVGESVPAPVYPTLDWRERRRGLTRDQIIDYYCQPGDAVL